MDSSTWDDARALAYIASHDDLRAALGADAVAARRHHAQFGAAEGRTISFDALGYLASHTDLRAAFGADTLAAARHYIMHGAREGRSDDAFDALGYIASYSDLRAAYGLDTAAATRHFVSIGASEGRTIDFDATAYLASHADLRAAFGADTLAATRHYILYGAAEGRTADFDALSYIASYDDLRAAFGLDTAAATRHFVRMGAAEGRSIDFDATAYLASYADLRAAFGTDLAEATRHFILFGAREGRTDDAFDALAYIASYDDLRAAFGVDTLAATRHFVRIGALEGRSIGFEAEAYLLTHPDLTAAGFDARAATQHYILYGANEGRSAAGAFGTEQDAHALVLADNVTGAIDSTGDQDWFAIDLASGTGVTFGVTVANAGAVLTIHDATGRVLSRSEASDPRNSFIAPASATYYVTVAATGGATGSYALFARDAFTITGTDSADTLNGSAGADLLQGLGGDDTLNGRAGNDVLEGGRGRDFLNGGLGDDVLYGNNETNFGIDDSFDTLIDDEGGNDRLFGQAGWDTLRVSRFTGPASTVLLDGGSGDDQISVFTGDGRALDTVTIRGGTGNDDISVDQVLSATIDAGDGNDRVSLSAASRQLLVTLGAGADVLMLKSNSFAFALANSFVITDFAPGVDRLDIDQYLGATLQNWDSSSNPFGSGHLRLVQQGGDTLLQLDRDGSVGAGAGFATLLTFDNLAASTLGVQDLGYSPDGSASNIRTLTGTDGTDFLTGTGGRDRMQGLAGDDHLQGLAGDDILEGGAGLDRLNGGLGDDILYGNNEGNIGSDTSNDLLNDVDGGDDQLFGQDGNDAVWVSRYTANQFGRGELEAPASTVLLDGGEGDDNIRFWSSNRFVDTVTIRGGVGNDDILTGSVFKSMIDAGEGNDLVAIEMSGGDQTVTLGAGADRLRLRSEAFASSIGNLTLITDFVSGSDRLEMDDYLSTMLFGWDPSANPFGTGHLRLTQQGADTLIELDRDGTGTGAGFVTLLTFANITAASLTITDIGFGSDGSQAPGETIAGTNGADTLLGTQGADLLQGLGGDDTLNGRAGNDMLEGGQGQDRLDGGLGDDVLYGNNSGNTGIDNSADSLTDRDGGNDQLFGQDGNDTLVISRSSRATGMSGTSSGQPASTLLLDGGAGDDNIFFWSDRFLDTVTVRGGTGNDNIIMNSALATVIDAGAGDDWVTITNVGGGEQITLGEGADVLKLASTTYTIKDGSSTTITDFANGIDRVALGEYLFFKTDNWDEGTNPFASGHLRLVQQGADTLLQIDRDGSAGTESGFATLLAFAEVQASAFTASDLGYAPVPTTAMQAPGGGMDMMMASPAAPELLYIDTFTP